MQLYAGAPVVTSKWGSSPERATDPEDDYFERHLREQDASSRGQGTRRSSLGSLSRCHSHANSDDRQVRSLGSQPSSEPKALELWERTRPMNVDLFARKALRGVDRNQPIIIVPPSWNRTGARPAAFPRRFSSSGRQSWPSPPLSMLRRRFEEARATPRPRRARCERLQVP